MRSRDLPITASFRWACPPDQLELPFGDHVVWDAPGCRHGYFAHRVELDRPPTELEPWLALWDHHHAGKGIGRAILSWETPLDEPFAPIAERYAPQRMYGMRHDGPAPVPGDAALPVALASGPALDAVIDGMVRQSPELGPGFRPYVSWLYRGLDRRGARTFAAFDGEQAVAAVTVVPGPLWRFQEVWTDRAWRRRGLATALVTRALSLGGTFLLQADANGEAIRIYERLGFRRISRVMEASRANE